MRFTRLMFWRGITPANTGDQQGKRTLRHRCGASWDHLIGLAGKWFKRRGYVIVIVLAVLATGGLSLAGVAPTIAVQVVAAVLAGLEAIRRITANTAPAQPGTAL
ncbi:MULTISPECIES: hypothetical protein [Streptomyces]|uniref:ABC transporter ATP-binding protein n=2 Tax=Streptomyces TaxID=1883 RepID=A0ABU4KDN3_9ACTN|nr:hypothetical protein [Streptomyces roseolus]MDX2295883.1 hypothetical protein [Streptomyces roseolus]